MRKLWNSPKLRALSYLSGMAITIYFGAHICAALAGASISTTDKVVYCIMVFIWVVGLFLEELTKFLGVIIQVMEEEDERRGREV